jgi:hypothetical protein
MGEGRQGERTMNKCTETIGNQPICSHSKIQNSRHAAQSTFGFFSLRQLALRELIVD